MNQGREPADTPRRDDGGFSDQLRGWLRAVLALPNDSPKKTVIVALALCLVCSVLVSSAAVLLRPTQAANAALDRKKNILEVAGLLEQGGDIDALFQRIERRMVDLEQGEFTDAVDAANFDQRKAARDPRQSVDVPAAQDIASIGRRARYAEVYLVRDGETLRQIILPVHGLGLWSTLYGFVALDGDLQTVSGLKFYDHAETPGLGGEVDNPAWRAKWPGKQAFDDSGAVRIEVIKGVVNPSAANAKHQVDGLAGATLTSRGVTNLLRYWLDEQGFGSFLAKLKVQGN